MRAAILLFAALSITLSAAACGRKGELTRPSDIEQKQLHDKKKQDRGLF